MTAAAQPSFLPLQGDCRELMQSLDADSIDAIVTDPPYGIGFMGKEWDTFKPEVSQKLRERGESWTKRHPDNPNLNGRTRQPGVSPSAVEYDRTLDGQRKFQDWTESWAREAIRVLKPGGHLVVFGAPRSHHRMMAGLEDAGFEIRDCLMWLFGQGFPKSKNLGDGWGTALKPAWEPIALARKPLPKGMTTTKAFEEFGTGGLAIDGCRISMSAEDAEYIAERITGFNNTQSIGGQGRYSGGQTMDRSTYDASKGRWPANLLLDPDAAAILDNDIGPLKSGARTTHTIRRSESSRNVYASKGWAGNGQQAYAAEVPASVGFPSRFFYCPKVAKSEREFGCSHLPARSAGDMTGGREEGSAGLDNPRAGAGRTSGAHNAHPTVKPIALMRWLVRLVTPEGGTVLDPFIGSGSTAIAATLEGHDCIGLDQESEWLTVADARVTAWLNRPASEETAA